MVETLSNIDKLIPVYIDRGKPFVWNAEDWLTLRSQHRICGALIGSVASYPRQNDFLGLPMALMHEEAKLLVAKGFCKLLELPNLSKAPSEVQKETVLELEKNIVEEQIEILKKRKIDQMMQKIDIIVAGKKLKLLKQGLASEINKESYIQEKINQLPSLSPAHVLVHIPTEDFLDTECRKVNVNILDQNVHTEESALKCAVFTDLWERGFYITNGSKFGCDYLVYPGDPVKFHALYMVRCVKKEKLFNPSEIVTYGRLAVGVNKLAVFAFFSAEENVKYQTLQWHDSIN